MNESTKKLEEHDFISLTKKPLYDLARYTFCNNIQCMGENFFNVKGIKESLLALRSMSLSKDSKIFMNSDELRTNIFSRIDPSPYVPDYETIFGLNDFNKEEIEVVFEDIHFGINYIGDKKKKWFEPIHSEFLPNVKECPTGTKQKYFYYTLGKKEKTIIRDSLTFDPKKEKLYQTSVGLFSDSLRTFSCFVGEPKIELNSNRYLDDGMESFREGVGKWKGTLGDFIKSAEVIEKTIKKMRKSGEYKTGRTYDIENRIKLFYPDLGMVLIINKLLEYTGFGVSIWTEGESVNRKLILPTTFIFSNEALELMSKDRDITRNF